MTSGPARCREKFLRHFPDGFEDETYLAWERNYKACAAASWRELISFRTLDPVHIAKRAVSIESRTNLLFSFEKMAIRDAVRSRAGANQFSDALHDWTTHDPTKRSFEKWCAAIERLPRKQTRVLTWPIVTVFGFLARPKTNCFLKPMVTKIAARQYGFEFHYESRPSWETYASLLEFADIVSRDLKDLHPRDMIDIQSFLWVQGSDEYP